MSKFAENFMSDVPRGVTTRYLREQRVPQSHWQPLKDILASTALSYDPENPGGKILVGALGTKLIGIGDNRHILSVAGSRAGKSVTLIANLFFYDGSILALDTKGDLAAITAQRRAALGQKVYVLDPFGTVPDRLQKFRASFNPMALLRLDSPTIIEDAGMIADAMVVQASADKDPHWDESARNFIEGVILHVATHPRYEGKRNLITVRQLIRTALVPEDTADLPDDAQPLAALEKEMLENAEALEADPATVDLAGAIEGAARDFYEKSEKERDSVLSTVRRHTKFLDYRALRGVLEGHDFDLADLKTGKVSVYLCLPASRMGLCNRWLRLFINQLLDAMERTKAQPAAPVLVCLDEFPVLGHMRQLEDAAGQIASFGVKLWVILQDWGQGRALYKERWESFAANAGIMQFFGNNDLTTSEHISKLLGKTPVTVAREADISAKRSEAGETGRSEVTELHELLTADEVRRQFARADRLKRQCVIWAGYHPLMIQRVEYFDEGSPLFPIFKGKFAAAD